MDYDQRQHDKLPAPMVREIRELRRQGYSRYTISLLMDVGTSCVTRYVRDIEFHRAPPLPNDERDKLLRQWRRPL